MDVHLLLGFFAAFKEGGHAWRRRIAGPRQRVGGLDNDSWQSRQRFYQGFIFFVLFAARSAALGIDEVKERDEVGRFGKLKKERFVILQCFEQVFQIIF